MIRDLFINSIIIVAFISIEHHLFFKTRLVKDSSLFHRLAFGFLSGVLGILLMLFSVKITDSIILDFRNIPLIVSVLYGGMASGILSGCLIAGFRLFFFGVNVSSLLALSVIVIALIGFYKISESRIKIWKKWTYCTGFYLILSTVAFASVIHDPSRLLKLLMGFWIGTAAISLFIAYYFEYLQQIHQMFIRIDLAAESAGIGMWELDLDTKELHWDNRMCTLYDISPKDFHGVPNTWEHFLHPEDFEFARNEMLQALAGEKEFATRFRILHSDGAVRYIKAFAQITRDKSGKALRMTGVNYDITNMVETEQKLHQKQTLIKEILDSLDFNIALIDENGNILMVNQSWRKFAEENDGKPFFVSEGVNYLDVCREAIKISNENNAQEALDGIEGVLTGGIECFTMEYPCHSPQKPRWFQLRAKSLNSGQKGCVISHIDLTIMKLADEKIRQNEAAYRALMNAITESAFLMDLDGTISAANETYAKSLNRSQEKIIGLNMFGLVPKEIAKSKRKLLNLVVKNKRPIRFNDNRPDKYFNNVFYPIFNIEKNVSGVAFFGRDVTEEKKAFKALRASEKRLRRAILNAPFPIMLHAEGGEILMCSRIWTVLTGYTTDDIRTIADWIERGFGWNRIDTQEALKKLYNIRNVVNEGEFEIQKKNGEKLIWDISSAPFGLMPDGRKLVTTMAIDITARKKAEKALEFRTMELERSNEELEEFALVASHDLREPLRAVIGFLQLLESRYGRQMDEKSQFYINRSIKAIQRMQSLISDLLTLSRVNNMGSPFEWADLNHTIEDVLESSQSLIIEKGAEIYHGKLPRMIVDEDQIRSLFQNLLQNALKYNEKQTPIIEITCQEQKDAYCFSVKDNGIGISPKFYKRIFQVFQRLHTQQEYQGSGLGLALCKKIVLRHGGIIWVESQPGEGSMFYFTLSKNIAEKENKII